MRCFGSPFKTRPLFKSFGGVGVCARGLPQQRASVGVNGNLKTPLCAV